MPELIQQYYAQERLFALINAGIGGALVVGAAALWFTTSPTSLARGMAYTLLITGVLLAVAGISYTQVVEKRSIAAETSYSTQSEAAVRQEERERIQKVLESGYTAVLAIYTVLILVGLVLLFLTSVVPVWKGVALSLMITGTLGHGIEAFSMQTQRDYLNAIGQPLTR